MDWPNPHPSEALGRPSRKGATVVLKAHLAVITGEGIKGALSEPLREEKTLGGQERRFCAIAVRELSRHMRLLDLAAKLLDVPPSQWARREDEALVRYALWRRLFCGADWGRLKAELSLPGPIRPRTLPDAKLKEVVERPLPPLPAPEGELAQAALRHSFPGWLSERISAAAAGEGPRVLAALNDEPSLWLRARPPGGRDEVAQALAKESLGVEPSPWAPDALRVTEPGTRVFDTAPMRQGRLQSQELGSQLICRLCEPERGFAGAAIVDYCAGAGGKTLYLADLAGKVIAHDRSKRRLEEARRRVKELKLRNVSFAAEVALESADVILVDAPCSGSGSLAREPERKWRIDAKAVEGFVKTQGELLAELAPRLRPGASLVYATCSLLAEENEAVVERLLKAQPGLAVEPASRWLPKEVCSGDFLRLWPQQARSGGFFAARLVRR